MNTAMDIHELEAAMDALKERVLRAALAGKAPSFDVEREIVEIPGGVDGYMAFEPSRVRTYRICVEE